MDDKIKRHQIAFESLFSIKLPMKESIQDIPVVFDGTFPKDYINNVAGWGTSAEELHSQLPDGTYKLITLDIDFGTQCTLRCPHCFQSNQIPYKHKKILSWDEIISVIDQAKQLGLKDVKILGAGEPFENGQFLDFLIELDKRDIHTAIFTKGHVLGSDQLTFKYFGSRGIFTSEELIDVLFKLKVSILLGFNSFDTNLQNRSVGVGFKHQLHNYTELRDRALLLLSKTGFNSYYPGVATRLALIAAPFKPENVSEVFHIYTWARERNIYVAACPTTSSGFGNKELNREIRQEFDTYMQIVKKLYISIYEWALERQLIKQEDFMREGVSLYPGGHPCNQVAGGLYIKLDGSVFLCPGNDSDSFLVSPNVTSTPLKEIWINSKNYTRAKQDKFNYGCIARQETFFSNHQNFYDEVFEQVLNPVTDGLLRMAIS